MATQAAGVAAAAAASGHRACAGRRAGRARAVGAACPTQAPPRGGGGSPPSVTRTTHRTPHRADARAPGRVKRPQPSGEAKCRGRGRGGGAAWGAGGMWGTGLSAPRGARAGGAPHACPGRSGLTVPLARTSPDARAPRGARTSEQPAWEPRGLRPWRPRPWRGSSLTRAGASTARRLAIRQPHDAGGVFAGTDLMGRSGAASR